MQEYMIGKCVRDGLVGRRCLSENWGVVGSTKEDMLLSGFERIEHESFVFLHPETRENWRLS